jgi:hypothetical protein
MHLPVGAVAALATGAVLLACTVTTTNNNVLPNEGGSPGDDASTPPAADGATVMATPDAAADAMDETVVPTPTAFVRVAHFSPDAPIADVCFAQGGSSWTGVMPQIAAIAAANDAGAMFDGGAAGLAFTEATSYLSISPGTYDVRLVAAGSADCNTGLADLSSVTFAAGSFTTVAAVGEKTPVQSDAALKLVSFTDDVTAPAGQVALRFINAAPGVMSADFGTGSLAGDGGPFSLLFAGVAFGAAGGGSDAGAVDANGYLAFTPLSGATLSAHVTASASDSAKAVNQVTVSSGAATFALVGGISGSSLPKLVECADVDDSQGTSLLSQCSVVSQ